MSINANRLVSITSRVIGAGSSDLETNGMLLSKSERIPFSVPALEFETAEAVSGRFGYESPEARFASQYFAGINNQQKAVHLLVIGKRVDEAIGATLMGAPLAEPTETLTALKKISDGSLKVTLKGEEKTADELDFSEVNSLSEAAQKIAEALGEVTGEFDSNLNAFIFTTTETGAAASITEASAAGSGTDVSGLLGLTEDAGAVASKGSDKLTVAENLNLVTAKTRNWVGFTTLYEADEEEATALAQWADEEDDYVYFAWSLDEKMLSELTQEETLPVKLAVKNFNCTAFIYGDYVDAAAFLAVGASIDWTAIQGIKTWFAKSAAGILPRVTDDEIAKALEKINVNYVGSFATRNADFDFFNRGCLLSGIYGFLDTLYGQIWLKNRIQRSIMDGFASVNRAPYNPMGYAFVEAWLIDPIDEAKRNGCIDAGLALSNSQVQQLLTETGEPEIKNILFSKGVYYKISDPPANTRTTRGSPSMLMHYTYAGSIQKIEMPLTTVI